MIHCVYMVLLSILYSITYSIYSYCCFIEFACTFDICYEIFTYLLTYLLSLELIDWIT